MEDMFCPHLATHLHRTVKGPSSCQLDNNNIQPILHIKFCPHLANLFYRFYSLEKYEKLYFVNVIHSPPTLSTNEFGPKLITWICIMLADKKDPVFCQQIKIALSLQSTFCSTLETLSYRLIRVFLSYL